MTRRRRTRLTAVAAAVALLAPASFAAAQVSTSPLLRSIGEWATEPTADQIEAARPAAAPGRGYVSLSCRVMPDGALSECEVKSEQPAGVGFGAAALTLTPRYRVRLPPAIPSATGRIYANAWVAWSGLEGPCLPPNCIWHPAPPPPPSPAPR